MVQKEAVTPSISAITTTPGVMPAADEDCWGDAVGWECLYIYIYMGIVGVVQLGGLYGLQGESHTELLEVAIRAELPKYLASTD